MDSQTKAETTKPAWIFNVSQHQLHWANDAGLEFWDADSLEELRDRDFSTDSMIVRQRLEDLLAVTSEGVETQEIWTLYPKGEPTPVMISIRPYKLDNGDQGLSLVIEERVISPTDADSLRIMEVSRTSAMIVCMYDLNGTLLYQNPAAIACYGRMPKRQVEQTTIFSRIKDRAVCTQLLARVADDEDFSWETGVLTQKGERTHSVSARRGKDPVTAQFVAIVSEEDVTDLAMLRMHQSERNQQLSMEVAERTRQLEISEKRYELALATAYIWDWDLESNHLYMSEAFVSKLGLTDAEFHKILKSDSIAQLVHPEDRENYLLELHRHLEEPDKPFLHEHRFLVKDGPAIWFRAQGKCILDAEGKPVRSVGLLTDISDRKVLERQLMVAQRLEAIGQLTGGIAHDFNNLLTIIQGNAELLIEGGLGEEALTSEIVAAVKRGASLTADLLAFARQQTLRPSEVSLVKLLERMRHTLLRALRENITIDVQTQANLHAVRVDPTHLESAVLNIALNSRDAMPDGGELKISCNNRKITHKDLISHPELSAGHFVEIHISDTGHGMDAMTAERVFEPFFTTKMVGRGSGLGLSMVQGFARQSGGDCFVTSQENAGTTLTLLLPATADDLSMESNREINIVAMGSNQHIHIVEDNDAVREATIKIIESLGYSVSASCDGAHARAYMARETQPKMYLIDVMLPDASGVHLAEELRQRHPDIPVVLMSGYVGDQTSAIQGKLQNMDLITKPFDRAELSATLIRALGRTVKGIV